MGRNLFAMGWNSSKVEERGKSLDHSQDARGLSRPDYQNGEAPSDRKGDGKFAPGNKILRVKNFRVGRHGVMRKFEELATPERKIAVEYGRKYAEQRVLEIARAFGKCSTGVGTMIESAGQALADARYYHALGLTLQEYGSKEMPITALECAKASANLTAHARACEKDAWELAAREAEARKKNRAKRKKPADILAEGLSVDG